MHIDHIALYAEHLEAMRDFYCQYFGGSYHSKYENPKKGFQSYFVKFANGARLEIMNKKGIDQSFRQHGEESLGFTHLAFSAGGRKQVDQLTARLRTDGYAIAGEPRTTGDGYYESVILDPEGNRIEITE